MIVSQNKREYHEDLQNWLDFRRCE